METSQFKGMGKRAAQNLAEAKNLIFRLVSTDGETILGKPEDVRTDRVCVTIVKDKIDEAWIG